MGYHSIHAALTSLLLTLVGIVAATQCYHPDGTVAEGDVPCSDDEVIHCCGQSSLCLSNGFCLTTYPDYHLDRMSCTDHEWTSPCPQNCIDPTYDTVSGPNVVATLGAIDEEYHFCCGYPVADAQGTWACPDNRSSFTMSNSRLMFGFAALENATLTSSATASSSTETPSAPTSKTTAPTSSGDSLASSDVRCEDNGTEIGLGVGVPLGVIALLAVAWGLWERKRVRTQSAAAVPEGNIRHDQSLHSDYENWNGQGNGYLQPVQQAEWPVVELRTPRSPVEMETHGGNEGHEF